MRVPKELAYSWEGKLVRFLGVPLGLVAPLVAALLAATYFVPGYTFGFLPVELELRDSNIPLDPYSWAAIVTSLLAGFTVFALPYAQTRHQADIAALAPVVPSLDRRGLKDLYFKTAIGYPRARLAASVFGWLLGLLIPIFSVPGTFALLTGEPDLLGASLPPSAYVAAAWFLVVVPFLIASLFKATYQMVAGARRVLRELESRIEVGPLDAALLRPLASAGLHTSFVWMVGAGIGLLFALDANIQSGIILSFMGGIAILGGFAAVTPVLLGRRILARSKKRALADVHAALARMHLDGFDPASTNKVARVDDQRLAQLGALLAYEQRLEDASETPLSAPAMAQFALYLAIPVFSWFGGAFVERAVDAALG